MNTRAMVIGILAVASTASALFAVGAKEAVFAKEAEFVLGEIIIQFKEGADPNTTITGSGIKTERIERLYPIAPVVAKIRATEIKKDKGWYWFRGKKYQQLSDEELFAHIEPGLPSDVRSLHRTYHLILAKEESMEAAVAKLSSVPGVEYAEPDYILKLLYKPTKDPLYKNQWFHNTIKSEKAWDITMGNPGITVAVIDSGIDLSHEDLKNNIWINALEIPDNGFDDDFNGYIDDSNGWNVRKQNSDVRDENGHGTLIAGFVAAVINNNKGVVGVSPGVKIMPVKVSGNEEVYIASHLALGINYAILNGANIINISSGSTEESTTVRQMVERANKLGIFIAAAAGNKNNAEVIYPAGLEEVLSVAGTDENNSRFSDSSFHSTVGIAAPALNVFSTMPQYHVAMNDPPMPHGMNYYNTVGTSYSCAIVAGAAALVRSQHPGFTPLEIINALKVSANPKINSDEWIGMGLLNAEAALKVNSRIRAKALITSPEYGMKILSPKVDIEAVAEGKAYKLFITEAKNTPYAPDSLWRQIGKGWKAIPKKFNVELDLAKEPPGTYFIKLLVDAGGGYFLKSVTKIVYNNKSPVITSLEPASGVSGAGVTANGYNFGEWEEGREQVILFGESIINVEEAAWGPESIKFNVPNGEPPGKVRVRVRNYLNTSNSKLFDLKCLPPHIDSLDPTQSWVGSGVSVRGTNFGETQRGGAVYFDSTQGQTSSWSDEYIRVSVPDGFSPGAVPKVSVSTSAGSSNLVDFTVIAPPIDPAITNVSPNPAHAGATVTITGTDFGTRGSVALTYGDSRLDIAASSWSDTSVTFIVASGTAARDYVLQVIREREHEGEPVGISNPVRFTVLTATPHIDSLSPASGPVGRQVTVSGTNFGASQGQGYVTFGGTTATASSWSDTQIMATVPSGLTVGSTVHVQVTHNIGAPSNEVDFTVTAIPAAPVVSSVSPNPAETGQAVTVTGTGFGTQGRVYLTQGSTYMVVTTISWSTTSITFNVVSGIPLGAYQLQVVRDPEAAYSNAVDFTVMVTPSITSLSPVSGPAGVSVTIAGYNFGASQGSGHVTFGPFTAAVTSWSASLITATVPSGLAVGSPVSVVVTHDCGAPSDGVNFTVRAAAPNITSVYPNPVEIGQAVTITGTGFGASTGTVRLTQGASYMILVSSSWSDTSITCNIVSGVTPGQYSLRVVRQSDATYSNALNFFVTVTPHIDSLSPASGPVGRQVTVSGTNFGASQGQGYVTFGGTRVVVSSWTDTQISAAVPSGLTVGSTVKVKVTHNIGAPSNDVDFTVTAIPAAPAVTGVSPNPAYTGEAVTITGTGFGTQGRVELVQGSTYNVVVTGSWSDTSVTFNVVSGIAVGDYQLQVVRQSDAAYSNRVNFTVLSQPQVSYLDPSGGALPGATVTIHGSSFGYQAGRVLVRKPNGNTTDISPVTWNNNTVTFLVPDFPSDYYYIRVSVRGNAIRSNEKPFYIWPSSTLRGKKLP